MEFSSPSTDPVISSEVHERPTISGGRVPAAITLGESDAQAVLMVRSVEESDSEGHILSLRSRTEASDAARDPADFGRFLSRRARSLSGELELEFASFGRLRRASRLAPAAPWLLVPAFVLGLSTNLLGPDKRINVVANPLAGLILWNLAVYLFLIFAAVGGRIQDARAKSGHAAADRHRHGLLGNIAAWLATWRARHLNGPPGEAATGRAVAGAHFLESWNRCAAALLGARARRLFHTAALTLVMGALIGMYSRGLLFEYRATWESTFLDAEAVKSWMGGLLGPASSISGIDLPDLIAIEAPQHGNAASWIHLYAITTALLVLVPRWILSTLEGSRARRLAASMVVPTDSTYFRRLARQNLGREEFARVWPYSYTLTTSRAESLKAVLHDVLGARARIRIESSVPYGELLEEEEASVSVSSSQDEDSQGVHSVLLFNLAQTPESEVHGRLARRMSSPDGDQGQTLVLVDQSAWRERADAATLERRLAERRRTWDRVLRDAGCHAVHLNLDQPPEDALIEALEKAWCASARSTPAQSPGQGLTP